MSDEKIEKFDRTFLTEYVQRESKNNDWEVADTTITRIVNLIEYFGIELYRPITRLLLGNWNELSERISHYTEEQWILPEQIEAQEPFGLDKFSIAMLLEVLEGEDTSYQMEKFNVKPISQEEIAQIRQSQDEQ